VRGDRSRRVETETRELQAESGDEGNSGGRTTTNVGGRNGDGKRKEGGKDRKQREEKV